MSRTVFVLGVVGTLMGGCQSVDSGPTDSDPLDPIDTALRQAMASRAVAVEPPSPQDPNLVQLGRVLFFDRILSGNRDIACATCHDPRTHGTDGLSLSIGTGGIGHGPARALGAGRQFVPRNAPTLLNRALEKGSLFWDGRLMGPDDGPFESPLDVTLPADLPNILAAQAMLPVLYRREMRGQRGDFDVFGDPNELAQLDDARPNEIWGAIMQRVLSIQEYREMFALAFAETAPSTLRFQHAATAIAAFITEAFTRIDSPFDSYLSGESDALTIAQKRGGLLFFERANCVTCHEGALFGGTRFANAGAPQLGPGIGRGLPLDFGRADVIDALGTPPPGENRYRFAFRVPSLRNVELTGPYMHDGAYATLDAVVHHYNDIYEALPAYDLTQLTPPLREQYHGDDTTIRDVLNQLDFRLRRAPLDLSETDERDLVAFLKSLTDPAARDLAVLIPDAVPSGLPVK